MSASAQKLFLKPHPVQTREMSRESTCGSIRRPHALQRISPETKPFSGAHSPRKRSPSASLEICIISSRLFLCAALHFGLRRRKTKGNVRQGQKLVAFGGFNLLQFPIALAH